MAGFVCFPMTSRSLMCPKKEAEEYGCMNWKNLVLFGMRKRNRVPGTQGRCRVMGNAMICLLCFVLLTLPFALPAQEAETGGVKDSGTERVFLLPPCLTFAVPCIESDRESRATLRGTVGFHLAGNPLPSESFFIGWWNALLFEKSVGAVYGLYTGIYGNAEEMAGVQISSLNESLNMNGLQIGIFGNLSESGNGMQISAFVNSAADWSGVQLATGGNWIRGEGGAPGRNHLLQIGLLNRNEKKTGFPVQIGLFNRSASRALQIGILNCSEKGFFKYFPIIHFL